MEGGDEMVKRWREINGMGDIGMHMVIGRTGGELE